MLLNDKINVIAFCSTLLAIIILAGFEKLGPPIDKSSIPYAMTGLIGVLGSFRPRTMNGGNA